LEKGESLSKKRKGWGTEYGICDDVRILSGSAGRRQNHRSSRPPVAACSPARCPRVRTAHPRLTNRRLDAVFFASAEPWPPAERRLALAARGLTVASCCGAARGLRPAALCSLSSLLLSLRPDRMFRPASRAPSTTWIRAIAAALPVPYPVLLLARGQALRFAASPERPLTRDARHARRPGRVTALALQGLDPAKRLRAAIVRGRTRTRPEPLGRRVLAPADGQRVHLLLGRPTSPPQALRRPGRALLGLNFAATKIVAASLFVAYGAFANTRS
jgi:hypothetical protein